MDDADLNSNTLGDDNTLNDMCNMGNINEELEIHTTQVDNECSDQVQEVPTRHKIEMVEEMNATNMTWDVGPESENANTTNESSNEVMEDTPTETGNTTHRYNLHPRPTRRSEKINLMQMTRQSTCKVEAEKPHLHVMMMQMSIKAGIKKFGKKGDEAVSKEL